MAYNEENNIGNILDSLIHQDTHTASIKSIIIVSSGSTDDTDVIVRKFEAQDNRVHLLTQPQRYGKASAVNLFMKNVDSDVIVMISADTIPVPQAIEALVSPFADPSVGMVGGHPIPTNPTNTFMGFGVHLLWDLHHLISLKRPKMGEMIAFRNVFRQIPYDTAVDEASIEPLIIGQGLKCVYAPDAVIYNYGPETVRDYIKQRRRIFSGHIYVKKTIGYEVSTMNGFHIAHLFLKLVRPDWRFVVWAPMIIGLEIFVRLLGIYDFSWRNANPFQWQIAESTKKIIQSPESKVDFPIEKKVNS